MVLGELSMNDRDEGTMCVNVSTACLAVVNCLLFVCVWVKKVTRDILNSHFD